MTAPAYTFCPEHGQEPLALMIEELRDWHARRQTYLRTQTALTNTARSMCRNVIRSVWRAQGRDLDMNKDADRKALRDAGAALFTAATRPEKPDKPRALPLDPQVVALAARKIAPILAARGQVHLPILECERHIRQRAAALPCAAWAQGVRGLGLLSFGQIVAEAGDLDRYANPNKLWKMMELGVVDGQRQRRVSDKELAKRMGYGGQRQAIMSVIADNLIKLNHDPAYRGYYEERKLRQAELHPDLTGMHREKRVRRELAKRLLRDLWRQWTGRGVEWAAA